MKTSELPSNNHGAHLCIAPHRFELIRKDAMKPKGLVPSLYLHTRS